MYRFSPKFALRHAALTASAAAIVCLSGCAGISGTAVPNSLTTTIPAGSVHGGQQPIQGAHVFVFAPGTTGYGSASTSLLAGGILDTTSGSITNGDFYVTTGPSGEFNYGTLTVACPSPATPVYLLATGGNPTGLQGGAVNGAIAFAASLGRCDSINSTTFTSMNEVTTAAFAFALNQFAIDGAHVGAPSTNATGIANAFASIANISASATGSALATTPAGNGVAPQATLNTLANIIAPCANSGSGASAACSALYTATTPTSSPQPTNVLTSLLNIAAFPGANVASLYSLPAAAAPFQPSLNAQPNDFSLGVTYSAPTTITQPGVVVVDGAGNTWMTNCQSCVVPATGTVDTLVKFNPDGTFAGSFGNGVLHFLRGIAVDTAGNVWTINQSTTGHPQDEIIEVTASGTVGTPITNADFGTNSLQGIAFDKFGTMWVTGVNSMFDPGSGLTQIGGEIFALNTSGTLLVAYNQANVTGSNLGTAGPAALAVDNSNNIWIVGSGSNSLYKISPTSATPTLANYSAVYTPTGFSTPLGIAINAGNELWITENNNTLSHIYGFSGANAAGSPENNVGLYQAQLLTTDGSGQVLIPNCRVGCPGSGSTAPDNLLRLGYTGSADTGGTGANYGAETAGFSGPGSAASDASGAVWVSNSVSGTVSQVLGFATPTTVPLSAAVAAAKVGAKP